MIILNGNSLGARQKDLNKRVNEAVKSNVSFDTYKSDSAKPEFDVDILFKIDLAARNKNIDYILEIIKSNSSFYISRALQKCLWLGDDEFEDNINVKNLHNNIFPHISLKMKKKLLGSLPMSVTNEHRASAFHEYCIEEKLYNAATKFLLKTSESYKMNVIQQQSKSYQLIHGKNEKYLVPFLGNSFILADFYLQYLENKKLLLNNVLYMLRHLYSISEIQYLNLLEKYIGLYLHDYRTFRFGGKISKNIMKSHKERVLKNPRIYVKVIKNNIMSKNSTVSDVKIYAVSLLPETVEDFWHTEFYATYKYIFDIIPATERFTFIKRIFTEKYANGKFETCLNFHTFKFFDMMTTAEKEEWAMRHVANGKELLGSGNDYKWYRFVNFKKAFEEIKKYILITPDANKRLEILEVLIDSVKNQNDLQTLLNYFYTRHVNETKYLKERFIDKLIYKQQVWNLSDECWVAFEKLFYSLDVFNKLNYNNSNSDYKVISIIYYILRKDAVLDVLNDYIDMDIISLNRMNSLCHGMEAEKGEALFQYFLQFYQSKVKALDKERSNDDIKKIVRYIELTLNLLRHFNKRKDIIPELINKHIKLNWETVKTHCFFYEPEHIFSENDILRYMKNDVVQVTTEFTKIKKYIEAGNYTNWLVRKLKIYFHDDIAHEYLQLVLQCMSSEQLCYSFIECAVYTIFNLAEDSYKVDFIEKYAPTTAKIDHVTIPQKTLDVQRAICSVACFSQPPLPMKSILRFITGDYVKYCLPIFNSYLMNLPLDQCIEFIESLIDKPVSVQKHGLRLAFVCFCTESLARLIKNTWKKSKNVSIRIIVYNELFVKVAKESGQTQLELFELLIKLTSDLRQEDHEALGLLASYKIPLDLRGQYLASAWAAVKKLDGKFENYERMVYVINSIEYDMHKVPEDVLIAIVDEHVANMLDNKQILNSNLTKGLALLIDAKWILTYKYLTYVYKEEQYKRNIKIMEHITKRIIEMWNEVCNGKYVMREFCLSFHINDLELYVHNTHTAKNYPNVNIMYRTIHKMFQDALPEYETYLLTWQLHLNEITRNIIVTAKEELKDSHDENQVNSVIQTSIHRFAEAFGRLAIEYIENRHYFAALQEQIECYINKKLMFIYRSVLTEFVVVNLDENDLQVMMCSGLVKYKFFEIYMFILNVLPVGYGDAVIDRYWEKRLIKDYKTLLQIIRTFRSEEVQYFMYQKFGLHEFEVGMR